MVDINEESSGSADHETPPVIESPVIKLVNMVSGLLGGGKKGDVKKTPSKPPVLSPRQSAPGVKAPAAKSPSQPSAKTVSPPKPVLLPTGPLMTVLVRNEFYRDGFRNMLRIALAEAVIIIVLILAFISYMNASEAQDHYFATTADGRIMQLVPLEQPNMGTAALASWAAQAATEVMTFGFHDYQRRMQQSSRHFTRYGWEGFTNALQKSRIIDSVEAAQQVVTAQPRSAPVLVQEGVYNGKYRWVLDLPLTVTYKAATSSRTDNLTVRLVIDRVPVLENPSGVGIEQWIATTS